MSQSEYLFNRRTFLQASGAALLAGRAGAADAQVQVPVKIGTGKQTYTLDESFGKLPADMRYGFGCAVVVDSKDRVIVTSRSSSPCVAIFDKDGKLLETWTKDFADKIGYTPEQVAKTAHGLYWSQEPGGEFLYWTENAPGNRVYKTDMQGKVLFTLGNVAQESSTSQKLRFDSPTDVAVAPNGDIYIVDGYGTQQVHRFDKNWKLLKTIGKSGEGHGEFKTCHGVWVNTLKKEPEVYIADRGNNRIEVYSPELEYKRTIPGMRLPCCFYQANGLLYIPELGSRVTVLDDQDKLVAHLGDGAGIKAAEIKSHPDKFATPHALTVDSRGDLYVVEWLDYGRARKFKHTPA